MFLDISVVAALHLRFANRRLHQLFGKNHISSILKEHIAKENFVCEKKKEVELHLKCKQEIIEKKMSVFFLYDSRKSY